jgi:DNA-binding CsgD family transcriptional regulator
MLSGIGFVGLELAADGEHPSVAEFLLDSVEKTLVVVGAGGVVMLVQGIRRQQREHLSLLRELTVARDEGAGWRRRAQAHVAGLASEMDKEFARWGLTDAEREVGLMLLKGLSHKEIASLRGTAATTVRQQARAIYQKSNLPGKMAFVAYFLEDLLPAEDLRQTADYRRRENPNSLPSAESGGSPLGPDHSG